MIKITGIINNTETELPLFHFIRIETPTGTIVIAPLTVTIDDEGIIVSPDDNEFPRNRLFKLCVTPLHQGGSLLVTAHPVGA